MLTDMPINFEISIAENARFTRKRPENISIHGNAPCFKAYDIRGRLLDELNPDIAYRIGLLAQTLLQAQAGIPVQSKTGHAFIKERMRKEDAIYGGEMSAHHYFRDFAYCDSGMMPWLLVARLMSQTGQPLSVLIRERERAYPASGEINRVVGNVKDVIERIAGQYRDGHADRTDGLSVEYPDWRFKLRGANTEPVLRLNVEARGDKALMERKTAQRLRQIEAVGG